MGWGEGRKGTGEVIHLFQTMFVDGEVGSISNCIEKSSQ